MDRFSSLQTSLPFSDYPALNGLGGWLDPETRDFSYDEKNMQIYVQRLPEESQDALIQGKQFLELNPFPWEYIVKHYNRYFPNEQETHKWFEGILKMIEEERKRQGLDKSG